MNLYGHTVVFKLTTFEKSKNYIFVRIKPAFSKLLKTKQKRRQISKRIFMFTYIWLRYFDPTTFGEHFMEFELKFIELQSNSQKTRLGYPVTLTILTFKQHYLLMNKNKRC